MRRYLPIYLACVLSGNAHDVFAQQLRDPTRPPAGLTQSGGKQGAQPKDSDLNLQSILIAPNRRSAIIDGRLLRVGEVLSGFKVVSIEEGAVTLRGAQGTRRLQLFPSVDKRRSLAVSPSKSEPPASQGSTLPASSESKQEES